MSVIQLIGTCTTIAGILDSIRKCRKARKKIIPFVEEALSSLESIKSRVPLLSSLLDINGIDTADFRRIICRFLKVEGELAKLRTKLQKTNKVRLFVSATERVAELLHICQKLEGVDRDLGHAITLAQVRVQGSVLLEASTNTNTPERRLLLENARYAFGTHALGPQLDRLVSGCRNNGGMHYLNIGKACFEMEDYHKSASYFKSAIKHGNRKAFAYLGRQYEAGLGMKENEDKAIESFIKGADLEDPECLYEMGERFEHGHAVEKNAAKGFAYYEKASNHGHIAATTKVGYCLYTGMGTEIDFVLAAKHWKAAAEAGSVHALCQYARCWLFGTGVEMNAQVAVDLLKIAQSQGSICALELLGHCFRNGLGVEEDYKEAFRLFREAAAENNPDVFGSSRDGGVAEKERSRTRYARTAAPSDPWDSWCSLAHLHRNGIGVEENKRKAITLFKRAVSVGDWPANYELGEMYRNGEGVAVNMKKAIHHFENHAVYHQDAAHMKLAFIFESDEEHASEKRALYHFRYAADLGNLEARRIVGHRMMHVRVSCPRKMSFTNHELQAFFSKIKSQMSRRNDNALNILSPRGLLTTETLVRTIPSSINSTNQPVVTENPTSLPTSDCDATRDIQNTSAVPKISFLELLSQKYPYWWVLVLALGSAMSLFLNILSNILISYFLYR